MGKWIRYGLFILGFLGIFLSLVMEVPYGGLLGAVFCFWAGNMVYALENLKRRILFFWFQVTLFTFLIGRPVIGAVRGEIWWDYGHENVIFALVSLLLTLTTMELGAVLGEQAALRLAGPEKETGFRYYLSYVSRIVFYSSLIFTFALGQEKIAYIANHTYYEYFVDFKSKLPYLVYELSTLTRYSMCFFLACFPKKSQAFPVLALYVLSAVPDLVVGERNPIALHVIFALSYYVLRDYDQERRWAHSASPKIGAVKEPPWIGRLEKLALIVGVPCGMVLLGMMNYIREEKGGGLPDPWSMILDLFYKQGVSFRWLALGHGVIPKLPGNGNTHYTFGSFIDYFLNGSIAQKFFGATALGSSNSMVKAHLGHNLSHHMSYLVMGEEQYLAGHGCGSSYLLEVFIDYGYLGIVIFSLLLGFLLLLGPELARKHTFFFAILLLCMTNLFLIPRAEATGFLMFVLTLQFWASALICCGGALMLSRRFYPRKTETFTRRNHYGNR